MRIAAISSLCPLGTYVIERLHGCYGLDAVVRVGPSARRPPAQTMIARTLRRFRPLWAFERRLYWSHRNRTFQRRLWEELFGQRTPYLPNPIIDVPQAELNRPTTVARLKELAPDVILVCSAPILREAVFSIASRMTINVHFGIAPAYRGANTIFWPLYFGDFSNVGVTIHQIDRGVDTGQLLSHGRAAMARHDDELALTAKSARLAAVMGGEVLRLIESGATQGTRQPQGGRSFRDRQRRLWHDLRLHLCQKTGIRATPERPEEIRYYVRRPPKSHAQELVASHPE